MKKVVANLIFGFFIFSSWSVGFAETSQTTILGRGDFVAQRFQKFVDQRSLKDIRDSLLLEFSQSDVEFLDTAVKSQTGAKSAKLLRGNRVILDGGFELKFNDNGSVTFNNGRVFSYDSSSSLHQNYDKVRSILSEKVGLQTLLIPRAQAFLEPMATAIYIVLGAAVATVATVGIVGNEIYQHMKDGTVICQNGSFVFRSKERNAIMWASSSSTLLPPADASKILAREIKSCDENSAKLLAEKITANLKRREQEGEQALRDGKDKNKQIKSMTTQ